MVPFSRAKQTPHSFWSSSTPGRPASYVATTACYQEISVWRCCFHCSWRNKCKWGLDLTCIKVKYTNRKGIYPLQVVVIWPIFCKCVWVFFSCAQQETEKETEKNVLLRCYSESIFLIIYRSRDPKCWSLHRDSMVLCSACHWAKFHSSSDLICSLRNSHRCCTLNMCWRLCHITFSPVAFVLLLKCLWKFVVL